MSFRIISFAFRIWTSRLSNANLAATMKLVTPAVGRIGRDKSVGRAEALRRAMLDMISKGSPSQAHPALWAPFVLVGEGAAARPHAQR